MATRRETADGGLNCGATTTTLPGVVDLRDIQRYCDAIASEFAPEKIILFGSHAYGEPHRDSDVDVLVVLPRERWRSHRPSLAIRQRIAAGFPVDILVKEPREMARRLRDGDSVLREIVEKGRVMYEASHA
jgi:predicted nucleotidyltransferase